MSGGKPLKIALVAGEHSGDQLGFKLMRALREAGGDIAFMGVGGEAMEAEGLKSLFPISDIAVMGIVPVLKRLRQILARIRETADAVVAARPDALVIIDSPDFTHRVARRVRKSLPHLPIVDYVSPSVWAWRPGRAKAMLAYVDCVLGLLPFEPEAYVRLGGPRCIYVGHPLIERLDELRPNAEEARRREANPPVVAVLPGSRRSEISRLMKDFGGALDVLREKVGPFDPVLPTLPHIEAEVRAGTAQWRVKPTIVTGEEAKFASFSGRPRRARSFGHRDARACARRRSDRWRLQGRKGRGAAQISHQGPLDPAAESHPRRAGDARVAAEGLLAAKSRRGARRPDPRRASADSAA